MSGFHGDRCQACGRPASPWHDSSAPGPTVRHMFEPVDPGVIVERTASADPFPHAYEQVVTQSRDGTKRTWTRHHGGPWQETTLT